MKTKSILSYFGSDSQYAENIAAQLDNCNHVTIPFFGGGGIVRHLKARTINASDKNNLAINFFHTLTGRNGAHDKEKLIEHASVCTAKGMGRRFKRGAATIATIRISFCSMSRLAIGGCNVETSKTWRKRWGLMLCQFLAAEHWPSASKRFAADSIRHGESFRPKGSWHVQRSSCSAVEASGSSPRSSAETFRPSNATHQRAATKKLTTM